MCAHTHTLKHYTHRHRCACKCMCAHTHTHTHMHTHSSTHTHTHTADKVTCNTFLQFCTGGGASNLHTWLNHAHYNMPHLITATEKHCCCTCIMEDHKMPAVTKMDQFCCYFCYSVLFLFFLVVMLVFIILSLAQVCLVTNHTDLYVLIFRGRIPHRWPRECKTYKYMPVQVCWLRGTIKK